MVDMKKKATDILEDYSNSYSQVDLEILTKFLEQIKSEAIKEFAERLKEYELCMFCSFPNNKSLGSEQYIVLSDYIDDLVKEMTEVEK